MADLIAALDEESGYVFVRSADAHKIPADLYAELQNRYGGTSDGTWAELRLIKSRAEGWIAATQAAGEHTVTKETRRPESPPATHHFDPGGFTSPLPHPECQVCGAPYERDTDPAGRLCVSAAADEAPHPLVLVQRGPASRSSQSRRGRRTTRGPSDPSRLQLAEQIGRARAAARPSHPAVDSSDAVEADS